MRFSPGPPPTRSSRSRTPANNTAYNDFAFQWEMWRPLYWPVNGTVPEIEPSMSIANPPVYSNGNKTVSITMKSNYKWSDGKPITANDLLFAIDLIKAAVKESPANWAIYMPGHFPDTLVSTSEPNSLDAGDEPQRPRQPVLVHRGRARRGTAAAPDAQLPVGRRRRRAVRSSRRPTGPRPT